MKLKTMQSHVSGATIVYADIYKVMDEMTQNPSKFGKLISLLYFLAKWLFNYLEQKFFWGQREVNGHTIF